MIPTPESLPLTVPLAEAFDIAPSQGEMRRISVGLPESYGTSQRSYPVLMAMESEFSFLSLLEAARLRARVREMEEIIVVGVGYPQGTDMARHVARRMYDFTTDDWNSDDPVGCQVRAMIEATGHPVRFGGAPALATFLTDELLPLLQARYRIDASDMALFGASGAGNFVGHSLFTKPGAFARYVAVSPAFLYNDGHAFDLEAQYAQAHEDLPATLHLTVGGDEVLQGGFAGLVSGALRMAELLKQRAYPGLELSCDVYEGRTHLDACFIGMQRGMTVCWGRGDMAVSAEHGERMFGKGEVEQ